MAGTLRRISDECYGRRFRRIAQRAGVRSEFELGNGHAPGRGYLPGHGSGCIAVLVECGDADRALVERKGGNRRLPLCSVPVPEDQACGGRFMTLEESNRLFAADAAAVGIGLGMVRDESLPFALALIRVDEEIGAMDGD